mmetsp:Transcript_47057/g.106096  ORF Transcript_47057/g.106096 Transcript_47057/m.106096 type:complete len:579 (-) Transcript_47057:146-1882(-)
MINPTRMQCVANHSSRPSPPRYTHPDPKLHSSLPLSPLSTRSKPSPRTAISSDVCRAPPEAIASTGRREPTVSLPATRELIAFLNEAWAGFSLFMQLPPVTHQPEEPQAQHEDGVIQTPRNVATVLMDQLASASQERDELAAACDAADTRVRMLREGAKWHTGAAREQAENDATIAEREAVLVQQLAVDAAEMAAELARQVAEAEWPQSQSKICHAALLKVPPPTYEIVDGILTGGGSVMHSDIDVVLDAFGRGYLSPVARAQLLSALEPPSHVGTTDGVPFASFVRQLLRSLAMPYREAEGIAGGNDDPIQPMLVEINALTDPMDANALAALYAGFRLFDGKGSGEVAADDLELVFVALDRQLPHTEVLELTQRFAAAQPAEHTSITFHRFLAMMASTTIGVLDGAAGWDGGSVAMDAALSDEELQQIAIFPGELEELKARRNGVMFALAALKASSTLDKEARQLVVSTFASFAFFPQHSPSEDDCSFPTIDSGAIYEEEVSLVLDALGVKVPPVALRQLLWASRAIGATEAVDYGLRSKESIATPATQLGIEAFLRIYTVAAMQQPSLLYRESPQA